MALYIVRSEDLPSIIEDRGAIYLSSSEGIQEKFCDCLEDNDEDNGVSFFNDKCIKEYLDSIGIVYDGNYKVGSRDWYGGIRSSDGITWRFVTYLAYWVQAAIIMLYYEERIMVCETSMALDVKYSPFVLKQRDVYFVYDDISYDFVEDYVKAGVDVYLYGEYLSGMSEGELFRYLIDKHCDTWYLTRELDAKVFPTNFTEGKFEKYEESIVSFAERYGAKCLEDLPTDITVLVNSDTFTSDCHRRYPLHQLFEYEGNWYYRSENSVKYPEYDEMLGEISFWLDDEEIEENEIVRNASQVLTLVLDCNEICNASKYWEHVGFVSVYNRENKTIEICERTAGIQKFHELLQQSIDLVDG